MSTTGPISRRTIVRGAAWAAPAIALVAAAPHASASTPLSYTLIAGCKFSGQSTDGCYKTHSFEIQICNVSSSPITVTTSDYTETIVKGGNSTTVNLGYVGGDFPISGPVTVQPGCTNDTLQLGPSGDSANLAATICFDVSYTSGGRLIEGQPCFYYPRTDPCSGVPCAA